MLETLKMLNRRLRLVDCGNHNITHWLEVDIEDMILLSVGDESPTVNAMVAPTEAQLLAYIYGITKDTMPLYLAFSEETGKPVVFGECDIFEFARKPFSVRNRLYFIRCSSQEDCISFAIANDENELLQLLEAEACDVDPNSSVVVSCTCSKNTPGKVEFTVIVGYMSDYPDKPADPEKYTEYTETYEIYGYYEMMQ